jgi:polyhydroxyalkanoate synthesis regulator protein
MQGFMGRYLEQSVASFVGQQQALQSQLSKMVSGTPLASIADLAQTNLAMWQQMQENLVAALKPRTASPAPAPGPAPAASAPTPEPVGDDAPDTGGSTRRPRRARNPRT